ncbi:MAG: hypothetical protein KatS3mg077_2249 [Candidatus Binatia bacterium]|nr:MAG: hypothetical protein KatS3mg077_2249 [Candidatus Binatia bacterium]
MDKILKTYLHSISELSQRGDAREESYYAALQTALEGMGQAQRRAIQVTVLPKKTEAGNPDFRVWDGSYQVIGYIEAKSPGTNLDLVETSEQLQRYLHTFPNLILTDFYEFRLYRQGVLIERALLARPFIAQKLKTKPPAEQVQALEHLFRTFLSVALLPRLTAEVLSMELAQRKRFRCINPQPVVGCIVPPHPLQTRFEMRDGLADERVTLHDRAAGTLTFPAEAIEPRAQQT